MNPVSLPSAWAPVARCAPPAVAARGIEPAAPAGRQGWVLQRRCSLAPSQFGACLGLVAFMCLAVAAGFWVAGVGVVSAFAGLELLLVAAAFILHARHAADGERLWLHGGRLVVERRRGAAVVQRSFDLGSLILRGHPQATFEVRDTHGACTVGACAEPSRRRQVLAELRQACAAARRPPC